MVLEFSPWNQKNPNHGQRHDGRGTDSSNHSLRATGTTTLFDAGVPEALIQKRSGHKSSKALRVYERITPEQDLAVSKILHSETKISYKAAKAISTVQSFDPDLSYSDEHLKLFEQLEY